MPERLLFAGKSVYLFGDLFKLPAVENVQVSQSPLWKHFQMVSLKENCRQSENLVYAELLNRIRIGNHSIGVGIGGAGGAMTPPNQMA